MNTFKNTGVRVREDTEYKEEASAAVSAINCPCCGRSIAADDEICPHCGARLSSDCTFCGNHLLPGEEECPECGMPTSGVRCPSCGTLNHRAFCRNCNAPLTRAAAKAVEKAKADPVFQKCEEIAEAVARIDEAIAGAPAGKASELQKEQKKLICSLNDMMKSMLPPPGTTPKEQMIFYSARKVAVTNRYVTRHKAGWICNYCGCTHSKPSECTKPQLGGHWIYEEKELNFTSYE